MNRLERVIKEYKELHPRSMEYHKKAIKTIPGGVTSTFRKYSPFPLCIVDSEGSELSDIDENEIVDFGMNFGAQLVGHANPLIAQAIAEQAKRSTLLTHPHHLELKVAELLCQRFRTDMAIFTNSGADAINPAIRLARHVTGKDIIIKFEGAYHGMVDALLVSTKPRAPDYGSITLPISVPSCSGILSDSYARTTIATWNSRDSVDAVVKANEGNIAAIICEPIMCNAGVILPQDGFLKYLREVCDDQKALLIFDEVKTGLKIAPSGACTHFRVQPDLICLAKAIGGGLPLGALLGKGSTMDRIADSNFYFAGTYFGNPLSLTAAYITLTEILTPDIYDRLSKFSATLENATKRECPPISSVSIGAVGSTHFSKELPTNYREWSRTNTEDWMYFWFSMVNQGVLPQPYGREEHWTISVAHDEEDIKKYVEAYNAIEWSKK